MTKSIRRLAGLTLIASAALAGCSSASHHVNLRYNPDGVQMTCPASELGWTATITGDGNRFEARCDRDGDINVWDAQ